MKKKEVILSGLTSEFEVPHPTTPVIVEERSEEKIVCEDQHMLPADTLPVQ